MRKLPSIIFNFVIYICMGVSVEEASFLFHFARFFIFYFIPFKC